MAKRSKRKSERAPVAKSTAPAGEGVSAPPARWDATRICQILLIAAAGVWIYWPSLHGGWLWDDDYLIQQNALVHDPEGIWDIWLAPTNLIDYFPITVSVEWLEWQIWPNQTFCYHLTNLILHLCSALLIWRLFSKLGLRLAWLGGLLFVVHPILLESVAWMAELKNTLSLPPFLLAMCAWIDYERRGRERDYLWAVGLFLVAMLCKTSMVMFPFVILLYAWWKRGRVAWADLKHSAPFFAISLAIGLAVIALLRHGVGEESIPLGGFDSRLACAGLSLSFYFSKCFLPVDLLPIYPQWNIDPPSRAQFICWPILFGALYWLWLRRRTWGRHALLGFGFFLINLLPFIGFSTVSFMRVTWVMDHLIYIPILGLMGLVVAALGQLEERLNRSARRYAWAGIAVVIILFAFESHRYAKNYVSSEALWSYTVRHHPEAWAAHNNLGNALSSAGHLKEAEKQYEEALSINPNYPEACNDLGTVLAQMGHLPEAAAQFREALRLCPDLESAQMNLNKVEGYMQRIPRKK